MENGYGFIKLGSKTVGHVAWLKERGYEVSEVDTPKGAHLKVKVSGFVETLDLSQSTDPLKEVVKAHAALTYSTKVLFPDGRTLFGIPACGCLGAASALVMKSKAPALRKSAGAIDLSGI